MKNIIIEESKKYLVQNFPVEMVERKGRGHPDTLIDGIMENVSLYLSQEYSVKYGKIRHHNVDKGLLCGGATKVEFGGGHFTKPIKVILSGRAYGGISIEEIAQRAARDYLRRAVPHLNLDTDVVVESTITEIWPSWNEVTERSRVPLANDTSFGIGYAPLTDTERLVLGIEEYLNSPAFKAKYPWTGEDIKVMGLRTNDAIELTVAVALISRYIGSLENYIEAKRTLEKEATGFAQTQTDKKVYVKVNHADSVEAGSIYLTVSGTSAEMGDDGSVGRGNRANGLITPFRPMTLEAIAGKNPVSHTGKIYSILAFEIAERIVRELPQVENVEVYLLSRIGQPIDDPQNVSALITTNERYFSSIQSKVKDIICEELSQVASFADRLIRHK
ncbi:methionine adenosyltransferase [Candidatus Woesearchaeota archaeon]|nr:methionine adenosyltransferase [Candidatus Woesearchaeota archaeon]